MHAIRNDCNHSEQAAVFFLHALHLTQTWRILTMQFTRRKTPCKAGQFVRKPNEDNFDYYYIHFFVCIAMQQLERRSVWRRRIDLCEMPFIHAGLVHGRALGDGCDWRDRHGRPIGMHATARGALMPFQPYARIVIAAINQLCFVFMLLYYCCSLSLSGVVSHRCRLTACLYWLISQ